MSKLKTLFTVALMAIGLVQQARAQVPKPATSGPAGQTTGGTSNPPPTPPANPGGGAAGGAAVNSSPPSPATATVITIDLSTFTVTGDIPFDKPFYLVLSKVDPSIDHITFSLMDGLDMTHPSFTQIGGPAHLFAGSFYLAFNSYGYHRHMLLPDRNYTLKITCFDVANTPLDKFSFTYGFYTKTKSGDHTKVDFGLGYSPSMKTLIGFSTVHFYFTALNDNTDLQEIHGLERNLLLRLSVFGGISPLTLSQATVVPIQNRFSLGNFVLGVGIRSPFYGWYTTESKVGEEFLQPMHLTVGEMLFKQASANPLITKTRNKGAVYFGLSYDLNLASIFGPVGKLLSP